MTEEALKVMNEEGKTQFNPYPILEFGRHLVMSQGHSMGERGNCCTSEISLAGVGKSI